MERNDRNMLILGILIILLLVVGYYFLLLGPLRGEFIERSEERSAKEEQLAQLEQEVAELEEVARNAPEIERQLLELSKRVPEQPEIPTFVVQVEEISEAAGVTQLSIQPGAPEPPPGGGDFSRVPITMTFEGTYEELQDFMSRLLDLARLVTVNEVSYEEVEQEDTDLSQEVERLLQVEINAEVYFQPEGVPSGVEPTAPAPPDDAPAQGGATGG
jgi:type IV pilus assembly protein PilO